MGASMGKQPTYTYGFPPRRRASNIESANTFNKDFWASNGAPGASESPGKASSSEFWMVDSERRYRQEVFDRESENFYPSASTYQTQNNFESTFSFNNSPMDKTSNIKPKPLSTSSSERSSRMALPSPSPPYTSRNSQQSMIRAGEPKYLPRCVVGM
uniref:Uncharacterized protein n=1 Tax=Panagrolaimus davidi TaxID=227884 RepID=A0A914P1C1_9BILA